MTCCGYACLELDAGEQKCNAGCCWREPVHTEFPTWAIIVISISSVLCACVVICLPIALCLGMPLLFCCGSRGRGRPQHTVSGGQPYAQQPYVRTNVVPVAIVGHPVPPGVPLSSPIEKE